MSENTKNTLIEAENVALRAELDEANRKIKAIEIDNGRDAEQRKTIDALTKNMAIAKKRVAELSANQPTAEQIQKLNGYDRLSAFADEQAGKLSALTGKYNQAIEKLESANERAKDNDERIKKFGLTTAAAKAGQKQYKSWMLTAIIASVLFAIISGGSSYYYVEAQLTPAETLSAEAREAFIKNAPEYRKIIEDAMAKEREHLRVQSEDLESEKRTLERDMPSWIVLFGIPFFAFVAGVVMTVIFKSAILVAKILG